jgi:type IX secretion system PorP/SprF family membrane protein
MRGTFLSRKRALIFIFCFHLFPCYLLAQIKPQYTQYIYNAFLINPAITGIEDYTDLRLGFRDQWTGIPDAPKTFFFTVQTPLGNLNQHQTPTSFSQTPSGITNEENYEQLSPHHGLGFLAVGDKSGPFTQLNLDMSYAYHLPLSNRTSLAIGFSAGIYELGLNANNLILPTGSVPDPSVKSSNRIFPDLNLGLWLYSRRYFVGASASNLITSNFSASSGINPGNSSKNYFLSSGYKIYLSRAFSLLPSFLIKYLRPDPVSIDFNVKASYLDRIWMGISLRPNDSFSILAGVNISPLYNIGYSFDYTTSPLASYSGGTHEIFLGFLINNINHHLCPRNVW